MKEFLRRYRHAWLLSYFFVYLIWFSLLEKYAVPVFYTHCALDDWIPFCAWFLIPYLLWFPYVAVTMAATCLRSRSEFCRLCLTLYTGMTLCLVFYTICPSGQLLRPELAADQGFLAQLIGRLYAVDTCTNVCPSIHVYNTLCVHYTICTWEETRKRKALVAASWILMILINASIVFLKQHSIIDGFAAIGLWLAIEGLLQLVVRRRNLRAAGISVK